MQFLNPLFLAGLMAAAIPIVLHFLHRNRPRSIPFAPLRFLVPSQERQMNRLHLRRLLLMLLRVAAIAMLVMALARPVLTGGLASLLPGGESMSVLILVDASASMDAQQAGGTVFDRAREEVRKIAAELDPSDQIMLALYHDGVEALFGEFLGDPELALDELARQSARPRGTDHLGALEDGLELLDRAPSPYREIYLVGDLQRSEIDSVRIESFRREIQDRSPVAVHVRAIEPEPFPNRQLLPVERPPVLLRSGQSIELGMRLRQDGETGVAVPVFLEVDGASVAETELQLAPRGSRSHRFPLSLPEAGDLGGRVRLRPDRYPWDDSWNFVLPVNDRVPLLLLRGIAGGDGERDPILFLHSALDSGGDTDAAFALNVVESNRFDPEELNRTPLVVGVDLADLGAARLASLDDYLRGGGTLLLFAGDPRVANYHDEELLPRWTSLRLGDFRGGEESSERFKIADLGHPVFQGFGDEERETLETVRLRNFYRLPDDEGRVLLAYAGGGAAAVEVAVGEGRLLLCGFHSAASAGDLPWSPMFLPLVQRLSGYLATAGWGRFGRQFESGEALAVEAPAGAAAGDEFQLLTENGSRLQAELDQSANPPRVRVEAIQPPGLYRFERNGEAFATVAVNIPAAESERIFAPASWLAELAGEDSPLKFRALEGEDLGAAVEAGRQGQPLHRWFLLIAFALFLLESLLSRRIAPARTGP